MIENKLKLRAERLENFIDQLRGHYNYHHYSQEADALIEFLTSEDAPVPIVSTIGMFRDFTTLLSSQLEQWDAFDDRLMQFATQSKHWINASGYGLGNSFYSDWMGDRLQEGEDRQFLEALTTRLERYNIPETDVLAGVCRTAGYSSYLTKTNQPTPAAEYVLARVNSSFLGITQISKLFPVILQHSPRVSLLRLLVIHRPAVVDAYLDDFLTITLYSNNRLGIVDENCVAALLEANSQKYEPVVTALLPKLTHPDGLSRVIDVLIRFAPEKYAGRELEQAYAYFNLLRQQIKRPLPNAYQYESVYDHTQRNYRWNYRVRLAQLLEREEAEKARIYLLGWLNDCPGYPIEMLSMIVEKYGQAAVDLVMTGIKTDYNTLSYANQNFYKIFFQLVARLDYSPYYSQIWALTRHKSKQMRELAAVTLAKLGDTTIPEAEKLLNDKKADARQTGALILSLIRTDPAQTLLMNTLDAEKNDDVRDLMLDSLDGRLPVPTTQEEIAAMVEKARKRGKLDAPVAPYLIEKNLPPLYWQTANEPLTLDTVRFLLYRQNRSKDIRPDPEAKPIYASIDRQRSAPFAKAVLNAYIEGGAEPKLKGCLTVGAMLGGDDEIDLLKTKVNQWVEGSRGKMAEYAVQAIALVGSNKALRAVEFYTRKYKNKNKNIGVAATEAFAIAAETLGISPYDLADSIIPDFGFDGLFRAFEAGGETYRAFVGTDFKLAFLNEDNKLIKTLPKAASTALKDEFKDMGKEIREIVKAQSGRLEQYLVIQRRWPADKWQSFFLGNPIMFAYAVRLIWGVFDEQQTLLFTVQCQEDQTLVNGQGDEVEPGDASPGDASLPADALIGIVHPLSLTAEQIAHWTDQLADTGIEPIFPQLERRVVTLPDDDHKRTMDRQFEGVEFGGYGFVSKMEKLGWFRGSVQDAGAIASYYKDFSVVGITAIVTLQGNIGVGYYEDNAILGEVMFVKAGSVRFGSYVYDDPSKDTDPRLIPFGEVPPIVYSEVMADMLFFRESDVRENQK